MTDNAKHEKNKNGSIFKEEIGKYTHYPQIPPHPIPDF